MLRQIELYRFLNGETPDFVDRTRSWFFTGLRIMKHPMLRISRGPFGALTLFLLCIGPECPPASAKAPPQLADFKPSLTVDKPSFFLGENVLVHYCLKNTSAATIEITLGTAHQRFKVTATDERGTAVPSGSPYDAEELMGPSTIRPGGQWCHSVSLLQYAQIERAGAYMIGVAYDSNSLPDNLDSVPETRTSITFVMPSPDKAESVVAAMESQKERPIVVSGKISPPYQDFSVMRYGIYLPPLLRRIRAGNIAAIDGIQVIPTPDATRALIDLTQDLRPEVVRRAAGALTWRLPAALGGTLGTLGGFGSYPALAAASWRPEFGPDARATARKLLTWQDEWDIRAGAFTIAAVGEVDDAPAVSAALSSNVSRRGVMQELTRAAEGLVGGGYVPPPPKDDSVGDMTIWLVALGRGARPSGWEDVAGHALNHAVSYVREAALNRIPVPVPESLIPVIRKTFDSGDPNEQGAACRFAIRSKLAELRGGAMEVFEKSTNTMTLNDAANAVAVLGTREEYVAALVDRLADPRVTFQILGRLQDLFEGTSGSGGSTTISAPAALALSTRWKTFVAQHRADIESGRKISLDDVSVQTDLVPPGWTIRRTGRPDWPR